MSPTGASVVPAPPSAPVAVETTERMAPPAAVRDAMATLDLADDDLVEAEPVRTSTPPPLRSGIVPKLASASRSAVAVPPIAPLSAPRIDPLPMPHSLTLIAPVSTIVSASVPPRPRSAAPAALREITERIPALIAAQRPTSGVKRARSAPAIARLESMLDPAEILFDGMYDLELVDSAGEAANVCASLLARALGARAVVVHGHDLALRELRVIGVHGERSAGLLGMSGLSDDDLVASAVICNGKPVTMRFDGELPRLAPHRLEVLGAPRILVAVPAMAWGRCVAIIEIIDADERFAGRVADSASYVAERLAAYLSGRLAA